MLNVAWNKVAVFLQASVALGIAELTNFLRVDGNSFGSLLSESRIFPRFARAEISGSAHSA